MEALYLRVRLRHLLITVICNVARSSDIWVVRPLNGGQWEHTSTSYWAHTIPSSGVGVSEANGIGQPEPHTLEALLTSLPEPALFIPTSRGAGLPAVEVASLPIRSGSAKNPSYAPLTPTGFTNFDWLVVLDSTSYTRGGLPLP